MTAPSLHPVLDLTTTAAELTRQLCDIDSVSGDEGPLADAIEAAVREAAHLDVTRVGDTVIARTDLGRDERRQFQDFVGPAVNSHSRRSNRRRGTACRTAFSCPPRSGDGGPFVKIFAILAKQADFKANIILRNNSAV